MRDNWRAETRALREAQANRARSTRLLRHVAARIKQRDWIRVIQSMREGHRESVKQEMRNDIEAGEHRALRFEEMRRSLEAQWMAAKSRQGIAGAKSLSRCEYDLGIRQMSLALTAMIRNRGFEMCRESLYQRRVTEASLGKLSDMLDHAEIVKQKAQLDYKTERGMRLQV